MSSPTPRYTQAELFVPLYVPKGPIYSSFKSGPVPKPAPDMEKNCYLGILHKKWDTLPEYLRARLIPPPPESMPSGNTNVSEDYCTPAFNVPPLDSSSDEDEGEQVTTPLTFDASAVKDAIKRHLQAYVGATRFVAVYIYVNRQVLPCIKDHGIAVDSRSYTISPQLTLAGSIAPVDPMTARETQAVVQMIKHDKDLICEPLPSMEGHEHVPLSRIHLAPQQRPGIARHNAEPYGLKHRLQTHRGELMQRMASNANIKAELERRWHAMKQVESDDSSDDDILWMSKSRRSAK